MLLRGIPIGLGRRSATWLPTPFNCFRYSPPFCSVRKTPEEDSMRSVINPVANVTTSAISNRLVRTVMAGVDGLRASSHELRLYHASPTPQRWAQESFAGKQKPAGTATPAGTGPSL